MGKVTSNNTEVSEMVECINVTFEKSRFHGVTAEKLLNATCKQEYMFDTMIRRVTGIVTNYEPSEIREEDGLLHGSFYIPVYDEESEEVDGYIEISDTNSVIDKEFRLKLNKLLDKVADELVYLILIVPKYDYNHKMLQLLYFSEKVRFYVVGMDQMDEVENQMEKEQEE